MTANIDDFTTLLVEQDAARADRLLVRLNRPDTRNAIDQAMVDEFHALCDELERQPRTLILTGTTVTKARPDGTESRRGIFASGADIRQLRDRRRDDALRGINSTVFDRIHRLPMPVIAAIDGFALGGGAELAYAADFRLATPSLKLGQPEVGLGIMAAAGATWRLKELVSESLALELLLTGRVLNAAEAVAAGLITALHDADELLPAAHALADRIAAQDPVAVRITKRVYHAPRAAHPVIDDLAQAVLFESDAKFDRLRAFLDNSAATTAAGTTTQETKK